MRQMPISALDAGVISREGDGHWLQWNVSTLHSEEKGLYAKHMVCSQPMRSQPGIHP